MVFFRLVLYFLVFSFAGWVSETLICSFDEKRFVKRGFLTGPLIPIYGFGGLIVVILLSPLHDSPLLLYIAGVISVTIFEYFTGWLMETIFHIRLWDYSSHRFQLKGRVWLLSSLFFGFLALFGVYVIFPPVSAFVNGMQPRTLVITGTIFLLLFTGDTVNSIITIISLNAKLRLVATIIQNEMDYAATSLKLRAEVRANWSQRRLLAAYPNMKSRGGRRLINFMRDQINENLNKSNNKIDKLKEEHAALGEQIDTLTKETKEMTNKEKI